MARKKHVKDVYPTSPDPEPLAGEDTDDPAASGLGSESASDPPAGTRKYTVLEAGTIIAGVHYPTGNGEMRVWLSDDEARRLMSGGVALKKEE